METRCGADSMAGGGNATAAGVGSSERERRATERRVAVLTAWREGAMQLLAGAVSSEKERRATETRRRVDSAERTMQL